MNKFPLQPGGVFLRICFLLAAMISGGFAEAQSAPGRTVFPDFTPDPKAYEYGLRGAEAAYSWWDLAEISLWASGSSLAGKTAAGSRQPSFGDLIREAAEELRTAPDLPSAPRERGEYILSFMHKRLLKSYSVHQTRLDTLLTDGRYNCVSSAVLYMILGVSVGLDVEGVMTRDHAFVTVRDGTEYEYIDVETTNPYGFDPGSRREFHDGFGRLTGFAYVPARNYRDRSGITQLELISLIMSNRIADLESRNLFGDAVPLAANRAALLAARTKAADSPFFTDPQKDLLDRFFNYGSSLIRAGKEEDALQWADLAGAAYPGDHRWQEFRYAAMNNLLVKLLRNRRIGEARETLDKNSSRIDTDHFAILDTLVLDAELTRLTTEIKTLKEAEAALEIIDAIQPRSPPLPGGRIEDLRTFTLLKGGELLAGEKGWQEAAAFIQAAIGRYGSNSRLENTLRVFRANRVTELHNTFAGLYNRGSYDEARAFIRAALEEFPGDRQLTADQRRADQAGR
jgi:tetratricopeptide (TPR) repeat protein